MKMTYNALIRVGASVLFFILHFKCSRGNVASDPCDVGNHRLMNATHRLHTIHGNNGNCDNKLEEDWYKVEFSGRPAEIPTVCLQNNVCGTQLPMRVDLAGKEMPVNNETVDAYVCTSYDVLGKWDCCVLRQDIKIKNCSNFYIYKLKPTDRCDVAYCAQEVGINPSANLTRKGGEDAIENRSTLPVSNKDQNVENHLTNVSNHTTSTAVSGLNMSESEEMHTNTQNITNNEETVTFTTLTMHVSFADNESTSTTPVADLSLSTNSDQTANVTTESILSNFSNRPTTFTSFANVTVTDNVTSVRNMSTILRSSTESSISLDTAFRNQTTNSAQTSTPDANIRNATLADLQCTGWDEIPCRDGNRTCYTSPFNNASYIVCADGSGCGIVCDYDPTCQDDSDEDTHLCRTVVCSESQQLCADKINCYTRCDGHTTCENPVAGEDEVGCHSSTKATVFVHTNSTSIASTVYNYTQYYTEETSYNTSQKSTQSVSNATITLDNSNSQTNKVTANISTTTGTSFQAVSTAITSPDLTDQDLTTRDNESLTIYQSTTTGYVSLSDHANETSSMPVTDSTTLNNKTLVNVSTHQGVTEPSKITTATSSTQGQTGSDINQSNVSSVTIVSAISQQTESSSQTVVKSNSSSETVPVTTEIIYETSESSNNSAELETTSSSVWLITSSRSSEKETQRHTTADMSRFVTSNGESNTIMSTENNTSSGITYQGPVQQTSSRVTDSTQTSTSGDFNTTTLEKSSAIPRGSDGELTSPGYPIRTSAPKKTFAIDDITTSTFEQSTSISAKISSVTETESVGDHIDHTTPVERTETGLYHENFGLFVFLIVAGVVIVGVCIFGVIGYAYQRRLRTWNPKMAYQDAYGDFEKKALPFGRDTFGVESPIPDFDILRDEKKFEETSLSQASTPVLSPTNGTSASPVYDNCGEDPRDSPTNDKANNGSCQQNFEVSHISNTSSIERFPAYDNDDGVAPVDDIDISPPRTLFPWIENAADTKL